MQVRTRLARTQWSALWTTTTANRREHIQVALDAWYLIAGFLIVVCGLTASIAAVPPVLR